MESKGTDSQLKETHYLCRGVKGGLSEEVTLEKNELRNKQVSHTTKFIEGQIVMLFNFLKAYMFY